jgi:hypothetical protein
MSLIRDICIIAELPHVITAQRRFSKIQREQEVDAIGMHHFHNLPISSKMISIKQINPNPPLG